MDFLSRVMVRCTPYCCRYSSTLGTAAGGMNCFRYSSGASFLDILLLLLALFHQDGHLYKSIHQVEEHTSKDSAFAHAFFESYDVNKCRNQADHHLQEHAPVHHAQEYLHVVAAE